MCENVLNLQTMCLNIAKMNNKDNILDAFQNAIEMYETIRNNTEFKFMGKTLKKLTYKKTEFMKNFANSLIVNDTEYSEDYDDIDKKKYTYFSMKLQFDTPDLLDFTFGGCIKNNCTLSEPVFSGYVMIGEKEFNDYNSIEFSHITYNNIYNMIKTNYSELNPDEIENISDYFIKIMQYYVADVYKYIHNNEIERKSIK
jgi:hypothetical protein